MGITLNPRKCRLLCFGKQSVFPDEHFITIHGNVVQHTTRYCFLGVWFDSYLTFRYHCEVVAKRIRKRNRVLCTLPGTSWGAKTRVLQRVFRSYVDPAGHYAVSTWGNVANNNNIRLVETARNDGLRIVSGLPKATKVENLRLFTGTINIRDLARSRAARIYDQALRYPQTPIAAAMAICVSLPRSLPDNVRDAATRFLAELGLLPVSRRPFPTPIQKDSEPDIFHCHYTPVTKADAPKIQRQAAYLLINNLRTFRSFGRVVDGWVRYRQPPSLATNATS